MGTSSAFVLKMLLLFWVVCAVMCRHHKRDVHRIVIKQRIPRSHKKGHGHAQGHDHTRGRHSSGRGHGHDHKKAKKELSYERDSSEEESYSRENSYEDIFQKHKDHKLRYKDSKKSHSSPSYYVKEDYDEDKQLPFKDDSRFIFPNEWIPLSSEQLYRNPHETPRNRNKKKRDSRRNYLNSLKPPPVDLTTSYPFQFDPSTVYPPLVSYPNAFSNFDLNKKTIESNQSPLIGTIEHPNLQFSEPQGNFGQLKNHQASYEVTELTPSSSNVHTVILVPDESVSKEAEQEATTKASKPKPEEAKSTQRPGRIRGRATYRGQKKA